MKLRSQSSGSDCRTVLKDAKTTLKRALTNLRQPKKVSTAKPRSAPFVCIPYPQLRLYGDSLTQHATSEQRKMQAMLTEAFHGYMHVLNYGSGGHNAKAGLLNVSHTFFPNKASPVSAVMLWYGANDASHLEDRHKNSALTIEEFINYHTQMINIIQKRSPATQIFVCTPPPVDVGYRQAERRRKEAEGIVEKYPCGRTVERTLAFANAVRSLAHDHGFHLVDAYEAIETYRKENNLTLRDLLADGLHLSTLGYEVVASEMIKCFNAVLKINVQKQDKWAQPVIPSGGHLRWAEAENKMQETVFHTAIEHPYEPANS